MTANLFPSDFHLLPILLSLTRTTPFSPSFIFFTNQTFQERNNQIFRVVRLDNNLNKYL